MNGLSLIATSWVDDPSCCFGFWVDGLDYIGDPDFEGEIFFEDGSSKVNLNPFSEFLLPGKEVLDALGGMTTFL